MKDSRNILLLFVSLCLVGTWVYHLYDKNQYLQEPTKLVQQQTAPNQAAINDSIRKEYSAALSRMDTGKTDNAVMQSAYTEKLSEIDSLKNEIYQILNINYITKEDLRKAEDKIRILQQKMGATSKKDSPVTNTIKNADVKPIPIIANAVTKPATKTAAKEEQEIVIPSFNPVGVSLVAMDADNKDRSTNSSIAAGSFLVSFQVQTNLLSYSNTEIFLSLTDPQGNVIQDDQWQAGMITTRVNGRIAYSRKISFSYTKGEVKKVNVRLSPSLITAGNYTVQVYHNGNKIGKADIRLN